MGPQHVSAKVRANAARLKKQRAEDRLKAERQASFTKWLADQKLFYGSDSSGESESASVGDATQTLHDWKTAHFKRRTKELLGADIFQSGTPVSESGKDDIDYSKMKRRRLMERLLYYEDFYS